MNKYLLDTNILSEFLKPQPNKQVVSKMEIHKNNSVTASIVIQEMVFGYQCLQISKKRLEIERYVKNIVNATMILPYTLEAAIWHGEERARLTKLGKIIALADGQIAAIAKVNHLILVTRNTVDFQYFSDIDIENWFITEERAKRAHEIRHNARLEARSMMQNKQEVADLQARDQEKYGNPDGLTFEYLVEKKSSEGSSKEMRSMKILSAVPIGLIVNITRNLV